MSNTIDQYREAKNNYLKLRNQAKKELVARFNELAAELLRIQRELLEDFGEKIAMPAKGKKTKPVKAAAPPAKPVQREEPAAPSPKIILIQKQIEKLNKKLADTQAAGKPVKAVQDRIYELEDEIRLLQEK
jgi:hypothetical protein